MSAFLVLLDLARQRVAAPAEQARGILAPATFLFAGQALQVTALAIT
jgi:hypothetical protein